MKPILLILSIAFSASLLGQNDKKYYVDNLNKINDSISKRLESYVLDFSHDIDRDATLNAKAKIRNSYFISVIQQTSNTGKSFHSILDSIPGGAIGHMKCFGKPSYFSEAQMSYPEALPVFCDLQLKVSGEIMDQITWSYILKERQTNQEELIQKAVDHIKKVCKTSKFSQIFISDYQNSKSHNKTIMKRGDGKYGTSTMYIIAEKQLPGGKWSYEIIIRNLIIFTNPVN